MAPPMIELCVLLVAGLGMLVLELIAESVFKLIFDTGRLFGGRGLSIGSSWPPGQPQLSLGPSHARRRKRRHATGLPFRAQQFR